MYIILTAIAASIFFILACVLIAEWATRKSGLYRTKERAAFRESYVKTVAQVFGGAAVVLAFAWTVIKDSDTLRQSGVRAANQQFVDAAKLMADEHGDARAAGIYSYEKLVTAYPEYYDPVANTLLAFIVARGPAKQTFEDGARPERIGADVNAAAYVLGTMPLPQNAKFWIFNYYLVGADFSNREAFRGAQFLGTTLYAAKFVYANLTGAVFRRAHLEDWIAYGSAKWDKRMKPARDPNDGWWSWERYRYIVNFDSANLKGAHFEHTSVAGASFRGADLTGVEFSGTDVSRADFRDELGRPNASLTDEQFKDACYGRDEVGRPPTQPLGLPKTIMEKLRPCG